MTRRAVLLLLLLLGWSCAAYVRLHVGCASNTDLHITGILLALRGQAVAVASLAGASLAVAGLMMQGLFRNPLAEPGILGVGTGAGLGGMLALVFSETATKHESLPIAHELYLALGCLLGALLSLLVLLVAIRTMSDSVTVLLTGVVLTSLLGSAGAIFRAVVADQWELSRAILNFSMGDITGKGSRHILLAAPLVMAGIIAASTLAPHFDLLSSGEEEAASLGVDVASVRVWTVIWTALLVAAATAIGGGVAFVGLLVPHLMRGLSNQRHRDLVPLCAIGGAILLVACDGLSIAVDTKSRIPLGGITGMLGAPLFLLLLWRGNARATWR